jgi:hypothetical protein
MHKPWAVVIAVLALVAGAGAAEAAISTACPDAGGTQYIVDTPADATDIQEGYTNNACDLIIRVDVFPTLAEIFLRAKSITIDPAPSTTHITLINNNNPTGSKVHLLAVNSVVLNNADVRAPKEVEIKCSGPACTITITSSTVISSQNLECGDFTGEVDIKANGDILIENSNIWGGKFLYIVSTAGNVTWHCGAGGGGCKDPNVHPVPNIILQFCEDPQNPGQILFPCNPSFANSAELREVCFPVETVCCGGAEAEVHLFTGADKTLDIEGSTLDLRGKIRIRTGILKANNTTIPDPSNPNNRAGNVNIVVFGSNSVTPVEMNGFKLKSTSFITVVVNTCPALPTKCIDADNSVIVGPGPGGPGPTFNGDPTAPYDPNVNDTAAECNPLAAVTINSGKYPQMNAAAKTGLISICNATMNEP